jgi:hypothetical protein
MRARRSQIEMQKVKFSGGEIVRLRRDRYEVKAGCCGIVWGVYESVPSQYEATFVTESGELADLMFEDQDCETISDIGEAPFPERLLEIQHALETGKR